MIAPDGSFTGYASLFGVADQARDIVESGAFAASLARRGARGVKMLWQHDPAAPVGEWTEIVEDARGLRVRGRILDEIERGREVLALLRAGIVDGLSIGFRTVRARGGGRSGPRRLDEIDLWEVSLVTFPMLAGARVGTAWNKSGTSGGVGPAASHLAARLNQAARGLASERTERRWR